MIDRQIEKDRQIDRQKRDREGDREEDREGESKEDREEMKSRYILGIQCCGYLRMFLVEKDLKQPAVLGFPLETI